MKIKFSFLLPLLLCSIITTGHAESIKRMSKRFAKQIKAIKGAKIAVLSFPYHDGSINAGSTIMSERFTTHLSNFQGFDLIERNLLNKMLEEMKLEQTGIIDQNTTKQLGKIHGIDVILTGTLYDISSTQTEFNARLIMAESGKIVAGGRGKIKKVWQDTQPVRQVKAPPPQTPPPPAPAPVPAAPPVSVQQPAPVRPSTPIQQQKPAPQPAKSQWYMQQKPPSSLQDQFVTFGISLTSPKGTIAAPIAPPGTATDGVYDESFGFNFLADIGASKTMRIFMDLGIYDMKKLLVKKGGYGHGDWVRSNTSIAGNDLIGPFAYDYYYHLNTISFRVGSKLVLPITKEFHVWGGAGIGMYNWTVNMATHAKTKTYGSTSGSVMGITTLIGTDIRLATSGSQFIMLSLFADFGSPIIKPKINNLFITGWHWEDKEGTAVIGDSRMNVAISFGF